MAREVQMSIGRRPHFYAFYSANLSAERLKIPTRFMGHMEGRTSGLVSLVGPSGNTWQVDLIQQNGDLFLHHGWPTFVRDHYIDCGDFLIFRYDGQLQFTVQVFDQSACEKEAAFHSGCSQDSSLFARNLGQKRDREEAISSTHEIVEGVLKKMRDSPCQLYLECADKNREARLDICSEKGCQCERMMLKKTCKEMDSLKETTQCGNSANENPALDIVLFKSKAIQNLSGNGDGLNMNGRVCVQMSSVHEVAQSFTSCFPYFVRIMKSFNVGGSYTLNIPYQFSMAHLPNCKVKIVLQNLNGECWTVNSVPSTRVHTSHTLCGGWMAFVRYNGIKIGDICIFELVRDCEFRVHILGVGNERVEGQNGKLASGRLSTSSAVTTHKNLKGLSKKIRGNSSKAQSKSINMLEISDKRVSKKLIEAAFPNDSKKHCSSSKTSTKVANKKLVVQRTRDVEDDLNAQARSGLRMMLALDEERAARSFSSCFPNFVKIMKRFNICGSYTLKIPHQFSTAHLPNCKTEVLLRNSIGECWTVNSVPDSKGRLVHTFCGGWMAFVRGNDLKLGDVCIFELVGKCELRVHISRVGRELAHQGEVISNELALLSSTSSHPSL